MSESLQAIRAAVQEEGKLDVCLDLDYAAWYNTRQGNYPYNSGLHGEIAGVPVKLRFTPMVISNTFGSFPVSSRIEGFIGDCPISGRFSWSMVNSAITGNAPVNDGCEIQCQGKTYKFRFKVSRRSGTIRLKSDGGGGAKTVIYKKGVMVQPDEVEGGGKGGPRYESSMPIFSEMTAKIEDIEVSFRFNPTYYTCTSSGRTPINRRAQGTLSIAAA